MDLEVVGRHALLFDDDSLAAFVNSSDALVEWHSLPIDRYDVRHLLSGPPPPRKRRRHQNSPSSADPIELELDNERFLDLPSPSDEQGVDDGEEHTMAGGYNAVGFSYGMSDESAIQKNAGDALEGSGFRPPFPVPENLVQCLPPTEKLHQIIARTAVFVSKHGGQSEIVLRVKQGDNPMFGFLMPDHHLHPYFRFLVDHQEVLRSGTDGKNEEEKKADMGESEALSLLGSVYGSGEDEDGAPEDNPMSGDNNSARTVDALHPTVHDGIGHTELSVKLDDKEKTPPKHQVLSSKDKAPASKKIRSIGTVKAGTTSSLKKDSEAFTAAEKAGTTSSLKKDSEAFTAAEKTQTYALPSVSKVETVIMEPPSDLKRLVEKIVEFIMKNGKEFEAVLVEQDTKHGRFPFLLPSNQYYPYYLNSLQKAQESKTSGGKKDDSMGRGINKKTSLSKDSDPMSLGSAGSDIPYDSDRKEKFKMVLGKSKKDGSDPPPKAHELQLGVTVDATAAAAILQAARRGIKYPNLEIFSQTSNGRSHGLSSDGQQGSSFASQPQSSNQNPLQKEEPSVSVPVAKAIAKTAALAAASEADSSEACLTREQKIKAERLKRAKMFASMIKGRGAPFKAEPLCGLSVERPDSGVSGSGLDGVNNAGKEREGSSVPFIDENEKSHRKYIDDENKGRRSKRTYRSRSKRDDDHKDEGEHVDVDEDDDHWHKERDHERSRKKHRSQHSSHHSKERHKHRKRHSSTKDRESQQQDRHDSSSEDEHRHKRISRKHSRRSHSGKEAAADLEEGEISTKLSDQSKASASDGGVSREASLDLSNSFQDERAPSQPTEVPDDFRAKIRAMLMATL